MIDSIFIVFSIIFWSFVIVALIIFCYAFCFDVSDPPKPTHYVWRHVYPDYKGEWERGRVTHVYCDVETDDIRGKVVRQDDGLYLATMWNGRYKEFISETEAIKSVEEYKPRVYK